MNSEHSLITLKERLDRLQALFRSESPRDMSVLVRMGDQYAALWERLESFYADLGAQLSYLPGDREYARQVIDKDEPYLRGKVESLAVEIEQAIELPMAVVEYYQLCAQIVEALVEWARSEVLENADEG